ncbi:universal stress protein [Pseudoduganella violacea]|uniref:Nucleotide-binding universal stress UspA family protein n=1 Tax=Pseudoduganella violacea TaxID=1715466 RepID=A0A7W5BEN3_9BURK|nr:universal stress protein [Pseudoduganella violacea]MBB3121757.1 nucleotide-binding universal stress UspA family protein [Pseudoduganella violacea]
MFTHLLIPTDGSPASSRAIQSGMAFAKSIGASVTGLFVRPEYHTLSIDYRMLAQTKEHFDDASIIRAQGYLAEIVNAAWAAGVPCEAIHVTSNHPYAEIIEQARLRQCDLIAMASHGRRGITGFLMGSETQKVLTHSAIPVLVFR